MGQVCARLQQHHASSQETHGDSLTSIMDASVYHQVRRQSQSNHAQDVVAAQRLVRVLDGNAAALSPVKSHHPEAAATLSSSATTAEYLALRASLLERERKLDFDFRCRAGATPLEARVDNILQKLRRLDDALVYQKAEPRRGYGGQLHPRFPGDHFLSNTELISQTRLFNVAKMIPKGAHLHIHFNACLLPHVLLDLAKEMDRMFITSSLPLVPDNDYESFDKCEIQFSILTPEREDPGDIFSSGYRARQTMHFRDFLAKFPAHYPKDPSPDKWLMDKLVFHEAETYHAPQTATG
jgi:adenosine deaminase CECR1